MIQQTQPIVSSPPVSKATEVIKRIEYVDIAKGIGIVLVVMGHNDFALISPFAHKLIYSFHMPMFFFMSGMFFKPDLPFWKFLHQRYNRVLKPFIAVILLIYFASISFSKVGLIMAGRRLIKALYANGYYLDWVQLWFLPHLFAVGLLAYFFYKAVQRTRVFRLRWLILTTIYIIGVFGMKLFWPFEFNLPDQNFTLYGLPFSLDIAMVSGFFFVFGYELNRKRIDTLFENAFMLVTSGIILILLVRYFPARIDFNTRQFDSLFINTIEALLGIFFTLALSKQMERVNWLSALFRYIGQASLVILIFQVPIQAYWGQKLLAITNNQTISYWFSFLAGVIGPIVINDLFIRPNPIVREWFSQSAQMEGKPLAATVFE